MPRLLRGMSDKEFALEMEKSFENEIDSDSDECKQELLKKIDEAKYIELTVLDGMVQKRPRTSVATLRVSKAASVLEVFFI